MTNEEKWKELQEFAEQWKKTQPEPHSNGACPNCGYCPHCGRGRQMMPLYPSYPWYPTGPTWISQPSIVWCNTGGITQGTSGGHFLTGMSAVSNI